MISETITPTAINSTLYKTCFFFLYLFSDEFPVISSKLKYFGRFRYMSALSMAAGYSPTSTPSLMLNRYAMISPSGIGPVKTGSEWSLFTQLYQPLSRRMMPLEAG